MCHLALKIFFQLFLHLCCIAAAHILTSKIQHSTLNILFPCPNLHKNKQVRAENYFCNYLANVIFRQCATI